MTTLSNTSRMVVYVAHPVAPTPEEIAAAKCASEASHAWRVHRMLVDQNVHRALEWVRWLRRSFPHVTFVAPWIASIWSGDDDSDPAQREAGLADCIAVIPRCDGLVQVGGRVSSGMAREAEAAAWVVDLTWLGEHPPDELYCATRGRLDVPWLVDREARLEPEPLADFMPVGQRLAQMRASGQRVPIDEHGKLTSFGWNLTQEIAELLAQRSGHRDNTAADCRVSLDTHDCCYVCNDLGEVLVALAGLDLACMEGL